MIWSLIVPNLIAKHNNHAVCISQSVQNKQSLASELSQHLGHKSHKANTLQVSGKLFLLPKSVAPGVLKGVAGESQTSLIMYKTYNPR